METKIKQFDEASAMKYPSLLSSDDESLVVLAITKTKRIVLHDSDGDYEVGATPQKHDCGGLIPFLGELTISN